MDHRRVAEKLFHKLNVKEFGFAPVRKELMKIGVGMEDIKKVGEELKKLSN